MRNILAVVWAVVVCVATVVVVGLCAMIGFPAGSQSGGRVAAESRGVESRAVEGKKWRGVRRMPSVGILGEGVRWGVVSWRRGLG